MDSNQWTAPMRQALAALQERLRLRTILSYAERRGVQLYVVGGPLRDLCLGRTAHDVDLALAGDVMSFARAVANEIGAAYVPLDPQRGEARVVYQQQERFDFARLRGESIEEDLLQRDFTINAMACPLAALLSQAEPAFIDPYGGLRDLQERRIRMVSPHSFEDDPLRLLRAFRFAATLECTIDRATLTSMETVIPRLREIAAERIHTELFTLFSASHSGPQLVTMGYIGLLDVLFPELLASRTAALPAVSHPDLLGHAIDTYQCVEDLINTPDVDFPAPSDASIMALRSGERSALIKCAALLHTIGAAPPCHPVICDASSLIAPIVPHPAENAAQLWEQIGGRLKLSRQRIDSVKTLLAHRHRPFLLATLEAQGELTLRLVHAWSKEVGDAMISVFALAMADAKACRQIDTPVCGARALGRCAVKIWHLYQRHILPVLKSPRLLTGHDLQHLFHLSPGPRFKTLLDALEVARVEGHVRTRAEALGWVQQWLQQGG